MATSDPRDWKALDRVSWRGVTLDRRTSVMLERAERKRGVPTIRPTQGSWSGTVDASAGTHTGAGAVDLSTSGLSERQKRRLVRALRDVGFAAWRRPYIADLWPEHVHAIAIGSRELAPLAAGQTRSYLNGCDGLGALWNRDSNSYRPSPAVVFDFGLFREASILRDRLASLNEEIGNVDARRDGLLVRRESVKAALAALKAVS